MAIEKTATPNDPDKVVNGVAAEIEIEVQAPIEEEGMIIEFGDSPSGLESGFGENLAELIDDDKLDLLGGELYEHFLADKESRSEWEDTYIKGLDQLGLTVDDRTEPWPGACGVFHPMLSEAVQKKWLSIELKLKSCSFPSPSQDQLSVKFTMTQTWGDLAPYSYQRKILLLVTEQVTSLLVKEQLM